MEINENTKLIDILNAYPALEPKLIAMDSRFKVISTGVGKLMLKKNTIKDASKLVGMSVPDTIKELEALIKTL